LNTDALKKAQTLKKSPGKNQNSARRAELATIKEAPTTKK